jgi:hypothetical protein
MAACDLAKEWLRYAIDGCWELIVEYEEKFKRVVDGVWKD